MSAGISEAVRFAFVMVTLERLLIALTAANGFSLLPSAAISCGNGEVAGALNFAVRTFERSESCAFSSAWVTNALASKVGDVGRNAAEL